MDYTLHCGDSLDIARNYPENSIDTIVTDPPYGLKFMGKEWDHGIPGVDYWKAFLRIAKPGAMLFAFGGTRTFHRLTVAIEDAGWEIRDCMMWFYGSGFPKSYNISKGIDKYLGADREITGIVYNYSGEKRNCMQGDYSGNRVITAPNTDQAKEWDGYGSALKPAWEPIIVAMKPLDGTFAENALKHGVAGLNIDDCRICTDDLKSGVYKRNSNNSIYNSETSGLVYEFIYDGSKGRFPANLLLDETSAEMLDQQSGVTKSTKSQRGKTKLYGSLKEKQGFTNNWTGESTERGHNDSGGASRFFYTAKASKKERGEYNNHPTVKPISIIEYLCKLSKTPSGGIVFDPFMGSGTTAIAALNTGRSFIGVDISQEYIDIAEKRINDHA